MRCLLLIDPAGRVVLGDVDSGARYRFDDVPTADRPTERVPARTAVWSPAGQWTAWSLDSGDLDGVQEIRLHHEGADSNRLLAGALTAFYLCPSPCGRYLSHLSPGPLGLELAVSEIRTGELRIVERGQPLFWSWSADGSQLAVHVEQRVVVVDVAAPSEQRELTDRADSFVAPWWTPDGSVVYAADGAILSTGPDGSTGRLATNAGAGRFALDPDGRRLAIVDVIGDQACLAVLDLLTGEREIVTTERSAAFFWSPEGRHLATLVVAGPSQLQWLLFDGEQTRRLAPFRPAAAWLREVLPFFEQYAQSHAVWSADGSQLVAAAVDADGSSEALVQSADPSAPTERLPGARLAWWAND